MSSPSRARLARRKKLVFALLLLVLVLAALELISFLGLLVFDRKNNLRPVSFPTERHAYERVMRTAWFRYDRELGWDEHEPLRGSRWFPPHRRYYASAYGDSFTFCADLTNPTHTWEYQFQQRTGQPILNFGIGAAGTDQAYLKLLRHYKSYPSQVVILGILPENINRLVSVVRAFYYREDAVTMVKPRYQLQDDGTIRLLPNPLQSEAEVYRLQDPAFVKRLAQNDFWYQLHKERYGFDLIEGRTFPSLPDALRLVAGLFRYPGGKVHYITMYDERDYYKEPYQLMQYLVRQFKARSAEYGFWPMVMIHATYGEVEDGNAFVQPLIRYIRREQRLPLLDATVLLRAAVKRGVKIQTLYTKAHYSKEANGIVAEGLARFLEQHGKLPPRGQLLPAPRPRAWRGLSR